MEIGNQNASQIINFGEITNKEQLKTEIYSSISKYENNLINMGLINTNQDIDYDKLAKARGEFVDNIIKSVSINSKN